MDEAHSRGDGRRAWRTGLAARAPAIGGMVALASGIGIGRFVHTPILPAMTDVLGLSKTEAGLIASANFLGYLAGALVAAMPRFPGCRCRVWFLWALVGGAATTALVGWVDTLQAFLLLRFVGGAASALVLVFGSMLVLDRLARTGLGGWGSVHFAGVGLGIALSAVLIGGLQGAGAGWRVLWLAAGATAAVAVPLAAWWIPTEQIPVQTRAPTQPDSAKGGLPRGLWPRTLCHGLFGFGYVVTATFIVSAMRASAGLRQLEGVVWLVVGLTAMPSVAGWSWIGRRLGTLHAYALACVAAAVGVAAGGAWQSPAGALLGASLCGMTFMGITALGFAAARDLASEDARSASAVMTAGFGVGQVVGPLVAGRLLDATDGSFAIPSLLAAAALMAAAVGAGAAAARQQPPPVSMELRTRS